MEGAGGVKRILAAIIGIMLIAGPIDARPAQSADALQVAQNREAVARFVDLLYPQKDVTQAFENYVVSDYIQQNPTIAGGRNAAIGFLLPKFANPTGSFEVKRIIVDDDHAVVHIQGRAVPEARGIAIAGIFRCNQGKIVEHWDVLQPIPETSINPHTMF